MTCTHGTGPASACSQCLGAHARRVFAPSGGSVADRLDHDRAVSRGRRSARLRWANVRAVRALQARGER